MPDQLIVTSTTDNQEQVNDAAEMYEGDDLVTPAADEGYETPINIAKGIVATVASTTDSQEVVDAERDGMDEEKEEKIEEHRRRGRGHSLVSRVLGEKEKWRGKYEEEHSKYEELKARYEPGQQASTAAEPQQRAQPQPPSQQQPPQFNDADLRRRYQEQLARMPELAAQARQKYPDIEEAFTRCDREYPLSDMQHVAMTMTPNPLDVGYYLANHPDKVARLWQLESTGRGDEMISEMNRFSKNLQDGTVRPSGRGRAPSTAPPPIRPVGGGASADSRNPGEMDYQDFKAWRNRSPRSVR